MPLYDYTCRACGATFELLVLKTTQPTCPSCKSEDLERHVSGFAVSSEATRQLSIKRARKDGEKDRKDKAIAEHEAAHRMHDH
jgi:putative FmdB family regulatory protein